MTRAAFDAAFAICLSATGAAYRTARDSIRTAGAEVDPWLAERASSADWKARQVAQALQLWRRAPDAAQRAGSLLAGADLDAVLRQPTVTGRVAPTRNATILWSDEEDLVPRLVELVTKERDTTAAGYDDALLALGATKDARAVPALAELLASPDDETNHQMLLAALGEIGDPSQGAGDAALARLNDAGAPAPVRAAAAVALGQMRDVRALPAMLALATDPQANGMVRLSATTGIGSMGDALSAGAVAALAALARGSDERLALSAVDALRRAASDATRGALAQLQQTGGTGAVKAAAGEAIA